MRKSKSTTEPLTPARRPRYRHPSRFYVTARTLHDAMTTDATGMKQIFMSRLFAMAQYLFTTPASGLMAERLYLAIGDAWLHNRTEDEGTSVNRWEREAVEHHTAILTALAFASGRAEPELEAELAAIERRTNTPDPPTQLRPSRVVDIAFWKRMHPRQWCNNEDE